MTLTKNYQDVEKQYNENYKKIITQIVQRIVKYTPRDGNDDNIDAVLDGNDLNVQRRSEVGNSYDIIQYVLRLDKLESSQIQLDHE